MAKNVRYRHQGRKYIVLALDAMIADLSRDLQITDAVSEEMDTIESVRQLDADLDIDSSEEDKRKFLNKRRDESIAELGHIQLRIENVRELKAAFESNTPPSQETIKKSYRALMDSVAFQAICLHGILLNPDAVKRSKTQLEQYEREKKNLYLYCQALTLGFGIWPRMQWHLFPFDSP